MNDQELLRYSRHILLPTIDLAGQARLLQSKVLIAGAGGLGCPAAMYLAASGVGQLLIADHDVVELSNLQRQIGHHTPALGIPKVHSLAETLGRLNPDVRVKAENFLLDETCLPELVQQVDVVLDCTDHFSIRQSINRACVAHRRPLVSGAAIRFEGQVAVYGQTSVSPCYACLYGQHDEPDDMTCTGNGVFSPLVGMMGSVMAAETIKVLLGIGESLDGRLLLCDALTMEWRSLRLQKDPACPVCSQ